MRKRARDADRRWGKGIDGEEVAMSVWREPGADARCLCDDGNVRTWAELTHGLDDDAYPKSADDEGWLLWTFGAACACAAIPDDAAPWARERRIRVAGGSDGDDRARTRPGRPTSDGAGEPRATALAHAGRQKSKDYLSP